MLFSIDTLTAEQSFLGDEPPGHDQRILVAGFEPFVHHMMVQDSGNKAETKIVLVVTAY